MTDTLTSGDGLLKDSYKNKITPQVSTPKRATGFAKLAPFRKRIKGINFSKYSGGVKK